MFVSSILGTAMFPGLYSRSQ